MQEVQHQVLRLWVRLTTRASRPAPAAPPPVPFGAPILLTTPRPRPPTKHTHTGRLAGLAEQAGIPTAAGTIEDLSKGVTSLADMLSSQVRAARATHRLGLAPCATPIH